MSTETTWVPALTCETGIEADMMRATLEGAAIPVQVSSARAGIFGAAFGGAVPGGFTIFVPEGDVVRARDLLGPSA